MAPKRGLKSPLVKVFIRFCRRKELGLYPAGEKGRSELCETTRISLPLWQCLALTGFVAGRSPSACRTNVNVNLGLPVPVVRRSLSRVYVEQPPKMVVITPVERLLHAGCKRGPLLLRQPLDEPPGDHWVPGQTCYYDGPRWVAVGGARTSGPVYRYPRNYRERLRSREAHPVRPVEEDTRGHGERDKGKQHGQKSRASRRLGGRSLGLGLVRKRRRRIYPPTSNTCRQRLEDR